MKKKIIFVTQALWIGGIETALVNLLKALDDEKYELTCLILQDDQTMADQIPETCRLIVADRDHMVSFRKPYKFARLFHLTEEASNPSLLHRMLMFLVPVIRWIENRLYICYIRKELAGACFDTAVIYSDKAAETAVRAVKAGKYLMFYHHGSMRKVYHDEIGYQISEKIIAVSRNVEEELRKYRPEYAHKMTTIHNVCDIDRIRRKAGEFVPEGFDPSKFNVVSCGRIAYEKGMDLAVEACAKLVQRGHTNIHWWIVGGGPVEKSIREMVQNLGMEEFITMTGPQNNPYPYIGLADLYVQPSRVDGYPMTILEALILGKPVVATDTDGAREILLDKPYGMLTETTSEDLALHISGLLNDAAKTEALQKECRSANISNEESLRRISMIL